MALLGALFADNGKNLDAGGENRAKLSYDDKFQLMKNFYNNKLRNAKITQSKKYQSEPNYSINGFHQAVHGFLCRM